MSWASFDIRPTKSPGHDDAVLMMREADSGQRGFGDIGIKDNLKR